jgi:hypothetical protein
MKFTLRDLTKLRWHALLAIFLLLAAGALGFWSQQSAQQANAERASAESQLLQIEQRLRLAHSEEQEIKERTALFLRLEKSGIAGAEKRLEWIELLRELQRELRLPGMNYEFGPQLALEKVDGSAFAFHSSHLRIQLRLLHEEDLLKFLAQLQQRAPAMVLVRSCRVSRTQTSGDPSAGLAQLSADCDMEWVTLRRATGGKQP